MVIEEVLTYLQDVLDAINDMESCFVDFPNRYDLFEKDIMRKCVVERKTEIMGEAINRIRKADPSVEILMQEPLLTHATESFMHTTMCNLFFCGV